MKKLNFPLISLIIFCMGGMITACTTASPPTSAPATVVEIIPTATPADLSLINTTGAFFALSVADINASADWYSEKLGLKIVMQPSKTGTAAVIVLEGGGLIVELVQHDDALPLSEAAPAIQDKTLVHGIFKVGIVVEDFDKTLAILKDRNVIIAFGPFPAKADQRANVIIQDNEGNLIQFFGK